MNLRLEQGRATRNEILAVATALFAAQGYERTSTAAILDRAGVSRGSLYHHFSGKPALFEAVLEEQEARIAKTTVAAARGVTDPVEALRAGCHAWLKMARDPVVRRIVLIDAPSAVGWEKWREIDERHGLGLVTFGLQNAIDRGTFAPQAVRPLAHLLMGAMAEAAMVIANASDPGAARAEVEAPLLALLEGLRA